MSLVLAKNFYIGTSLKKKRDTIFIHMDQSCTDLVQKGNSNVIQHKVTSTASLLLTSIRPRHRLRLILPRLFISITGPPHTCDKSDSCARAAAQ